MFKIPYTVFKIIGQGFMMLVKIFKGVAYFGDFFEYLFTHFLKVSPKGSFLYTQSTYINPLTYPPVYNYYQGKFNFHFSKYRFLYPSASISLINIFCILFLAKHFVTSKAERDNLQCLHFLWKHLSGKSPFFVPQSLNKNPQLNLPLL